MSAIGDLFVMLIKTGAKTINDVPKPFQKEVEEALKNEETTTTE